MRLKFIFGILIALLFGYSGFWLVIAGNTEVYLESLKPSLQQHGIQFSYEDYEVSGFPYRLVVMFKSPTFHFENGVLSTDFAANNLEVIAQPWKLGHFIMFPEKASIDISYISETEKDLNLRPAATAISFRENEDDSFRFSLEMKKVQMQTNLQTKFAETYEKIDFHIRRLSPTTVTNDDLFEPKLLDLSLSMKISKDASFSGQASFRGTMVPALEKASLAAWRDSGGTLEIEKALFKINASEVIANGSLTIDNELRPLGSVGIDAANASAVFSLLHAGEFISGDIEKQLSGFLNALPLQNDEPLPLKTSLTIQDGIGVLGPFPLFELGPVLKK